MKSHTITGGGSIQLHIVKAGKPNGRPVYSSMAFRNAAWLGTRNCDRTWPMTTGSSRWTCAVMASPTSPERATPTRDRGPTTLTR